MIRVLLIQVFMDNKWVTSYEITIKNLNFKIEFANP
jgi:hypothetical protein